MHGTVFHGGGMLGLLDGGVFNASLFATRPPTSFIRSLMVTKGEKQPLKSFFINKSFTGSGHQSWNSIAILDKSKYFQKDLIVLK